MGKVCKKDTSTIRTQSKCLHCTTTGSIVTKALPSAIHTRSTPGFSGLQQFSPIIPELHLPPVGTAKVSRLPGTVTLTKVGQGGEVKVKVFPSQEFMS